MILSPAVEESFARRLAELDRREPSSRPRARAEHAGELEELQREHIRELERVAGLSAAQAKQVLLKELEDHARHDARPRPAPGRGGDQARRRPPRAQHPLGRACTGSPPPTPPRRPSPSCSCPADDMKGRIIGREGRNIRALENLTGVDFIIDDTPNAVVLSGFDGVRREIARMTLEKLLPDGRIHPARIEETYYQAKSELEAHIVEPASRPRFEANVQGLDPELVRAARPPALPHQLRPERARPLGRVRPPGGDDGRRAGRLRQDRPPRRAAARHRQGGLARDRGPARARRRRPGAPPRRVRGGRPRDGGPPQRGRAPDRRGRDRPGRRRALRRAARAPAASRSSTTSSACATSSRSPPATTAWTRSTRCRPAARSA